MAAVNLPDNPSDGDTQTVGGSLILIIRVKATGRLRVGGGSGGEAALWH